MSKTQRVWFSTAVAVLLFLVVVQVHDALAWRSTPWPGFTLGPHGTVNYRHLEEVPEELRPLLERSTLSAVAVRTGETWHALPAHADPLVGRTQHDALAAGHAMRAALGRAAVGDRVGLRVVDPGGVSSEVGLALARLPEQIFLQRSLLYPIVGFFIAAFGLLVFRARPSSREALAFAIGSGVIGTEFLIGPVLGGPTPRFEWLAVLFRYATGPAWMTLVLALGPRAWVDGRPWVHALPWIVAFAAILAGSASGSVSDGNGYVAAVRVLFMVFAVAYVLCARLVAPTRQEARKLELYIGSMVASVGVVAIGYSFFVPPSPYLALGLLLIPVVFGYGILMHRLFDVEVVFRRSVAWGGLFLVAALVYGALAAAVGALFGDSELARSPVVTGVFLCVAVLIGGALRPRVQQLVDRGINLDRFRYLEALRDASAELGALRDEREAAESLVRITTEVAGLECATVFLNKSEGFVLEARSARVPVSCSDVLTMDEPLMQLASLISSEIHRDDFDDNPRLAAVRESCLERMSQLGAVLLLPLTSVRQQLVGLLALGPRRDGAPINSEDLDLLKTVANQAALVIDRARARSQPTESEDAGELVGLAPGARVGHYRLGRHLGRGGMGSVYEAIDERLRRRVALKFIVDPTGDDLASRLRREAHLLANLNHPNITQLHALEEVGSRLFLAMEYLANGTLAEELEQKGSLPADAAIAIALDLSHALAYAHEQQVIHRDIKLSNVMRNERGVIKLTDFGLAKLAASQASLTGTGKVVGTLAYLAPELLRGKPASAQSDMYALGVLLYHLLTGHPLWGTEPSEQLARLTTPVEAPRLREGGVAECVVGVLARLLSTAPGDRYAGYGELIDALREAHTRAREATVRH